MSQSKYIYRNVQDKLMMWNTLIRLREIKKWTYEKIGAYYGVSDKRIRTEYANAVKVREWNTSVLWHKVCDYTLQEPASYAVRLYGLLITNNITTMEDLLSTPVSELKKIKGIGVRYIKTLLKIRTDAISEIDTSKKAI